MFIKWGKIVMVLLLNTGRPEEWLFSKIRDYWASKFASVSQIL